MKKLLLLVLLLLPTGAFAQCNGVFPNNTVCGNITGAGALPRPTNPTSFLGAAGGTNGQIQYNNNGALGGQPISTCDSVGQVLQYTVGVGFSCVSAGAAGSSIVFTTRATVVAQDLSAFTVIRTLGYAVAGDGGGATFQKVAPGTPFIDVYITAPLDAAPSAAGSGYINGTYQGVALGGGTGLGCAGRVTVAGGVVTLIEISATICPGYSVGDVLTPNNTNMGGSGTGATYTVSTISTAVGSFVDSAGNRWQIVTDAEVSANVRQFGAKLDWNGSDVGATNDRLAFLAGISFTMYPKGSSAALINGGTLLVPKGAALLCGGPAGGFTLVVPQGVILRGAGRWGGTQLVQCEAEPQNTHFILVCGIYTTRGQFGCAVEELAARSQATTTAVNTALYYSISGQQFPILKNVGAVAKLKNCVFYDQGIGGAANAIFENIQCVQDGATANDGFFLGSNMGGTLVILRDSVFECSPQCTLNYGINIGGGSAYTIMDGNHIEGHTQGYNVNNIGGSTSIRNSSISSVSPGPCTAITIQGTNPNNTVLLENIQTGCATTVSNGHGGGTSVVGPILLQMNFNP
jgi:hypothetical protein